MLFITFVFLILKVAGDEHVLKEFIILTLVLLGEVARDYVEEELDM